MRFQILIFSFITLLTISLKSQIVHVPIDQPTIQAGINAATDGDTVLVDDGIYEENIKFIGKAITVASNFILDADTNHINNTIIDGSHYTNPDSAACVMFINGEDTTSVLNGFTITGGQGVLMTAPWLVQCGGGVFAYYSGSKIMNNKISYNNLEGDMAGGVGIASIGEGSWIVIENNLISYNSSEAFGFTSFGGGIAVTTNSIIRNNIIQYNTCLNVNGHADGGGIEVDLIPGSTIQTYIYNNVIQFNEISGYEYVWGAGISINNTDAIVVNNIIQSNIINGNTHLWGAGICFRIASGIINNNLIIDNQANGNNDSFGGGIYLDPPTPSDVNLSNNTISNNSVVTAGGGIYSNSISTELINGIFWNNSPDEIAGSFPVSYSNIMGSWQGEGNINEDPLFMGSGDHPYSLQDSSLCVNSGSSDIAGLNLPYFDLTGNPRFYGGRIDMGAYENQNVIITGLFDINQSNVEFNVFPNPVCQKTTFEITLTSSDNVIILLLDMSGKHHKTIVAEKFPKGKNKVKWNADQLNDGVYFIRLETKSEIQVHKIIIIK